MEKSNRKNQRTKRNIIVSAVLAILLCIGIIVGATFALFTSEDKVNVSVTSGTVEITAVASDLVTYSGKDLTGKADVDADKIYRTDSTEIGGTNGIFANGGTAKLVEDDGTKGYDSITLTNMTPGDKVTFNITIENKSNVAIKYRTLIMCVEDGGLYEGLQVSIDGGKTFVSRTAISKYATLEAGAQIDPKVVPVTITLPSDRGNEYQNKSCSLLYKVEAIQANAAVADPDESIYELYTATDLKWFRNSVNDGTLGTNGKTFKLMDNIDLVNGNWMPIGIGTNSDKSRCFKGTFDGNGKIISNLKSTMYVDKKDNYEYGEDATKYTGNVTYGTGLFGSVDGGTVKNLVIENADVGAEYAYDGRINYSAVGIVTGYNYGNSTYDNITIKNSTVMSQTKVGAIVGLNATPGQTITITNCHLIGVTVKGNYSYSLVAGLIPSSTSTINMSGTTVDENSKTVFWTSDICEFKGDSSAGSLALYSEDSYTWEYLGEDYSIIKCNNAWAVQRGNGKNADGQYQYKLSECIIYTGAGANDKVEYLAQQ